ncbi:excinuclease ABC subunit UvrB [archaeon]|nr:excinuclease ABC subunit UvrB [archaeon]
MEDKQKKFKLVSNYKPQGSQPKAIKSLLKNIEAGKKSQTLLGVTGSGKTFTMANVIAKTNKPTLIIAHNKTLAAQLYEEFKDFFPENRVEYFISYYDYYQPESYLPAKDQYIEKDSAINPRIEMMRHATTASLRSRRDVIVIASVSCIYGLGNPKYYSSLGLDLKVGEKISRDKLIRKLVDSLYERNDIDLNWGKFRVNGDTIDFIPGYMNNIIRVELFGSVIERITELDRITNEPVEKLDYFYVYPAKHYVVPESVYEGAIAGIEDQLELDLKEIKDPLIAHRIKQRTKFDIEMIKETGTCKGIENYSRHFDGRSSGEQSFCLLDYFGEDFMIMVDESHRTIPQVGGMFNGDRARKTNLIDYGFRLTSAYDNRPLKFNEFEKYMENNHTIFVSATPGAYEYASSADIVEQIIRPTGLIDPVVEIRPLGKQILDVEKEIKKAIKDNSRILLTTLTKRMAEEITDYLSEKGIKTRYMHSEINAFERTEIIRELRLGEFDCLVGINLLREGLDIPEVGLVGILDADKEGFLRDAKSLIQTIGRAARNSKAKVILYADKKTGSIKEAIKETSRRRKIQIAYNKKHGITPQTIQKPIKEKLLVVKDTKHIPKAEIPNLIIELDADMKEAAELLEFERAIQIRNKIKELEKRLLEKS